MTPVSESPAVTVIVPVYNAARFLPEGLPLLLERQGEACEVIAVDDASTDNSLEILREHGRAHPQLRIETLPANRGVSAARNRGLELARGRYVLFVDADDRLQPGAVEALLRDADRFQPDIILFQHRRVTPEGRLLKLSGVPPERIYQLSDPRQYRVAFDNAAGNLMAWNGFYRREALGDLRFQPFPNGEDVLFGVQAFCRAQTLLVSPRTLYDYVERMGTASRRKNARHCISAIDVACEIVSSMQASPLYPEVRNLLFRKIRCMTHGLVLTVLLAVPQSDRPVCWKHWFDRLTPVYLGTDLVPSRQRWIYRLAFGSRSRWIVLLLLRLPIQIKAWLLSSSLLRKRWIRLRRHL